MSTYKNKTKMLAKEVVDLLIKNNQTLAFAESMTGGLLASEITGVMNASQVLKESLVVYSDAAKIKYLHCQATTIDRHSVYSLEVIQEMIDGLKVQSHADVLVAVSGIAGPKTYNHLDVGTVFIGIEKEGKMDLYKEYFKGDRQAIRYQTAIFIFENLTK